MNDLDVQQVEMYKEALLNAYVNGDVAAFERARKVIEDLIDDKVFHDDLKDYEEKRKQKLKKLFEDADKRAKEAVERLKSPELWNYLGTVQNELSVAVSQLENEYYDTVKSYIVGWVRNKYGSS